MDNLDCLLDLAVSAYFPEAELKRELYARVIGTPEQIAPTRKEIARKTDEMFQLCFARFDGLQSGLRGQFEEAARLAKRMA